MKFERVICLVADGFGVGALPDASLYGDEGSHTFQHAAEANGGLYMPHFEKLGIGLLGDIPGIKKVATPLASIGKMQELSAGKDTTTGHWEIAGIVTEKPFALFPSGFPDNLVQDFIHAAKIPGFLGNVAASGTVIIEQLGEEHLKTGKPILYTSGDSVFQVAAHEESFGLERLYEVCKIARKLVDPYQIARVIARPFIGKDKTSFKRTEHRKDYSLVPNRNLLDALIENKVDVLSVGKIDDIFNHRGITAKNHTGNNQAGLEATYDFMVKYRKKQGFIFANLVDFDMLYGHRRDAKGFARCLESMDAFLPKILNEMTEKDCLILTADHGCDPTFKGTDHTREYAPLVVYSPKNSGDDLGIRKSFSDISKFILSAYGIEKSQIAESGSSFLWTSKRSC